MAAVVVELEVDATVGLSDHEYLCSFVYGASDYRRDGVVFGWNGPRAKRGEDDPARSMDACDQRLEDLGAESGRDVQNGDIGAEPGIELEVAVGLEDMRPFVDIHAQPSQWLDTRAVKAR